MKNILIINAHEFYSEGFAEGRLNNTLVNHMIEFLKEKYEIKTTVINSGFDKIEEAKKFQWADFVIIQTPIYWMNVPTLFKKYMDTVFSSGTFFDLTQGDAYGHCGLMKNKKYMISSTWNAPIGQFNNKDGFFEGKSVDDLLFNLNKSLQFIGLEKTSNFSCHSVVSNPLIDKYKEELTEHLKKIF